MRLEVAPPLGIAVGATARSHDNEARAVTQIKQRRRVSFPRSPSPRRQQQHGGLAEASANSAAAQAVDKYMRTGSQPICQPAQPSHLTLLRRRSAVSCFLAQLVEAGDRLQRRQRVDIELGDLTQQAVFAREE